MEIVPTKKFDKDAMKTVVEVPKARDESESTRAFQWMLFKPQAHAVTPFSTQEDTRGNNTTRSK
jgi:hypothetical protein